MKKTTKEKVVNKIITAPQVFVGGRVYNVLPHKAILKLSASEDSATRRLREMAQTYGKPAFELKDEKYFIRPKFVTWLCK